MALKGQTNDRTKGFVQIKGTRVGVVIKNCTFLNNKKKLKHSLLIQEINLLDSISVSEHDVISVRSVDIKVNLPDVW